MWAEGNTWAYGPTAESITPGDGERLSGARHPQNRVYPSILEPPYPTPIVFCVVLMFLLSYFSQTIFSVSLCDLELLSSLFIS